MTTASASAREQILQATCTLLENQGYHGTGLSEIVQTSGAPKGSIYYYFPGGKEEIVAEAMRFAGQQMAENIRTHLAEGGEARSALRSFIEQVAYHVEVSGFRAGGPLTIVSSETATTSERINLACREAYVMMQAAFAEKLEAEGRSAADAMRVAGLLLAAMEGAIVLSRTYHTVDPLRQVAAQVSCLMG